MTDPIKPTPAVPPRPAPSTMEQTYSAATKALDATRDGARDAAKRTAKAIEANPLPVLVGGLAIGALAAAMLPRTAQEAKLLGSVGKRLNDTATGAAMAARDAGKAELDSLGLNKNAARDQVGKVIQGVLQALSTAGTAAATASKKG